MSISILDIPRKLLPRWRSPQITLGLGEMNPIVKPNIKFTKEDAELLRNKHLVMKDSPNCQFASDLLATAMSMNAQEIVKDTASFILKKNSGATKTLRRIAYSSQLAITNLQPQETFDDINHLRDYRSLLQKNRVRLRHNPNNALLWMESSRQHAILGNLDSAIKAANIAIHLQPNHRYLLRSMVRLLVHGNRESEALILLQRSPLLQHDPWIQASEIALANLLDKSPKSLAKSSRAIRLDEIPPHHAVELAASLCTLLYSDGKVKRAKRIALIANSSPNENVAAQLAWLNRQEQRGFFAGDIRVAPYAFEYDVWRQLKCSNFEETIISCDKWYIDEPYSTRASEFASYISMIAMQDYIRGEKYCKQGLIIKPDSSALKNNLAVAQANLGNVNEAIRTFQDINWEANSALNRATQKATAGLLLFRAHDVENGRLMYKKAINLAKQDKNKASEVSALLHLAKEEINIQSGKEDSLLEEANKSLKLIDSPPLQALLVHLNKINKQPVMPYSFAENIEGETKGMLKEILQE